MRRAVFDEDHESFRKTLRAFIQAEVVPHYQEWYEAGIVPRDFYYKLGDLGIFGIEVPEEYGGAGISTFKYYAIEAEETTRAGVSFGGSGVHAGLCLPYLLKLGTPEQLAAWLPGFVTGETMFAIAMTEPGTGSDLAGMRTTARKSADGSHYVLNGAKTFITGGVHANRVIVCARTSPPPPERPPLRHLAAGGRHQVPWLLRRPQARQDRPAGLRHRGAHVLRRDRARGGPARRGGQGLLLPRPEPPAGAAQHRLRRLRAGRRRGPVRCGVHKAAHRVRQGGRVLPEHEVRAGRLPGQGRRRPGRRRPRARGAGRRAS